MNLSLTMSINKTNHFRKCALETQLDAFLGSLMIDVPNTRNYGKYVYSSFLSVEQGFNINGETGSKSPRKCRLSWEENIKKFGTVPKLWLPFAVKLPMNGKMIKYRVKIRKLRRTRLEAKRSYYMKSMLR